MSSLEPGGVVFYEGQPGRRLSWRLLALGILLAAGAVAVLEPYFVLDRVRDAVRDGDDAALRRLVDARVLEGPFRLYLEASRPAPGTRTVRRYVSPSRFEVRTRSDWADSLAGSGSTTVTLMLERRGFAWKLADITTETRTDHFGAVPPPIAGEPPGGFDAAPPRGPGDLPRFGEYVYVEELPEVESRVAPGYPEIARRAGVEGTVLIQALVGRDGLVKDARVTKSIPMLDSAAIEAVRRWRFSPARARGEPVAVWVAVPVRFRLH
jgi:TonB family protein